MCGLFFAHNAHVSAQELAALTALLNHRGPDAQGYFQHKDFFLGSVRLAILDLNPRANQPFVSASGKHVIAYNGEIYNYRELAAKHGLHLRTSCDTELLVELFELLGEAMLNELNGMFAFVILNTETDAVFAARDRLGVKPLYIYESNGTLAMASELAPLLDLSGGSEVDEIGLRQYKKLRVFFGGRTLYKKTRFFPAAHFYKNGQFTRYWQLPGQEQAPPSDEELTALIESAVSYRMISDVPVGCYLSGGLDSSIITVLARPADTWSVGFPDHNEFVWAGMAAQKAGAIHHDVTIDEASFLSLAREMILKRREPLSVPNEVLLYALSREARPKNKVLLCGEGADELFFGYDRIFRWAAEQQTFDFAAFDQHYSYGKHLDPEILEDALAPFVKAYRRPVDIVAAFFQIAHLHGLLRRLDNSSMLASVEARAPFVDYRLVERMAGVRFEYRMKDGVVKAPLKRIFGPLLPPAIVTRAKVGFPVPLAQLFHCPEAEAFEAWTNFNLETLGLRTA